MGGGFETNVLNLTERHLAQLNPTNLENTMHFAFRNCPEFKFWKNNIKLLMVLLTFQERFQNSDKVFHVGLFSIN